MPSVTSRASGDDRAEADPREDEHVVGLADHATPPGPATSRPGRLSRRVPGPPVQARMSSGRRLGTGRSGWTAAARSGPGRGGRPRGRAPPRRRRRRPVVPIRTVAPDRAGDGDRIRQLGGREPGRQEASGIDRERPLVVRQPRPAEVDEAPAVEHDDGRGGRPRIHPLRDQLTVEQARDADRRRAGAQEQEPVGAQAAPSPRAASRPAEHDRRRCPGCRR